MDIIRYKIESSNPALISQAVWKLFEAVKQKIEAGANKSTIPEYKELLLYCSHGNRTVSVTAVQAMVALAESGTVEMSSIVQQLSTCLFNSKYYDVVTSAICELLTLQIRNHEPGKKYVCPYNLAKPRHPLITVLVNEPEAWRSILDHVQTMMNHCKVDGLLERYFILLRPVFTYMLCIPTLSFPESCRQRAWHLLIPADHSMELRIEILQWLRVATLQSCEDTNDRILELARIAIANREKALCSALQPLIMSMAFDLLESQGDPRENLDTVSSMLGREDFDAGGVLISLLSEMVTSCPGVYLLDVITAAATIMEKTACNRTIAHAFIASILQWMAYPSVFISNALDLAKDLIDKINNKKRTNSDSRRLYTRTPYDKLRQINNKLNFHMELCITVESASEKEILVFLEKLEKSPNYIFTKYKLIVCGIFLESEELSLVEKACNLLIKFGKNDSKILPIILYKLSKSREIEKTKILLSTLPKLVKLKENLPIVLQLLKAFSAFGNPLSYFAVELYLQSFATEPRTYRYFYSAIVELSQSDSSWRSDVTCARAMKYVCEMHSEHGAGLVPLLSQILNRSSGKNGGTATALAINSISALCVSGVMDFFSSWRELSPKMREEQRPIVVTAICAFFGDIPRKRMENDADYDKLVVAALTKLWDYALNSKNPEIQVAAIEALENYELSDMTKSVFPAEFLGCEPEEITDPESNIPPSYWFVLLQKVSGKALLAAENLLRHFIREELKTFRPSMYQRFRVEPFNFKYLPEASIIRAIGEHIRQYKSAEDEEKKAVALSCLKIFAHKYEKVLPPNEWKNLQLSLKISMEETVKYEIPLLCHQAPISPSAKEYLENYLTKWSEKCANLEPAGFQVCMGLYENLDHICRSVGSNFLTSFLDASMNIVVEKATIGNENTRIMFSKIMECFSKALNHEHIHNDNRSVLRNILEKLMDRLHCDSTLFQAYTNAVLNLGSEELERITLPSVWLDVTTEKLKKAIFIRAEYVIRYYNTRPEVSLKWMNEVIQASASKPATHSYLFEQLQRILPEIGSEKSSTKWTLDLTRRITSTLNGSENSEEKKETALFFCEILFISVVCMSAMNCLLLEDRGIVTSHEARANLFPQALASIGETAHWEEAVPNIMIWLNYMQTTSIPKIHQIVFHNALVALKNVQDFEQGWSTYVSSADQVQA